MVWNVSIMTFYLKTKQQDFINIATQLHTKFSQCNRKVVIL
jgi:hypothetical protein